MAIEPPKSKRARAPLYNVLQNAINITPSDSDYIGYNGEAVVIERLYIGSAGSICIETVCGQQVTYQNVGVGYFKCPRLVKVLETGTTASMIIGEY